MLCLHGKPAVTSTTENGTSWTCDEPSPCHFSCPKGQKHLYVEAVEDFLSTGQPRPLCCMGENCVRNYAKLKVVTSREKGNFGRPYFVCSKKEDGCRYFEWGDRKIVETPLCSHQWPSRMLKVKKEGPNKGRSFFCCRERGENSCKFFKWTDDDVDEEEAHMTFLRAKHPSLLDPNSDTYKKGLLEKRMSSKELDNKNEPVATKKRKTL